MAKAETVAALKAHLRALERVGPAVPPLSLGAVIDSRLPGCGLEVGCLHQICFVLGQPFAAMGFAAWIAGLLVARLDRPALWIGTKSALPHPPAAAALGLPPARLIVAEADSPPDQLWSMEEALRCPDLACVLAQVHRLDPLAGRRLQLAAEAGGVTGLILHPILARTVSGGQSRWRVAPTLDGTWHLGLDYIKGGSPALWRIKAHA